MKKLSDTDNSHYNSKYIKSLFSILALGSTFISAYNGYAFYHTLLGTLLAVLISYVFEVSRVACLFSILNRRNRHPLILFLYVLVIAVCSFASINSYNAGILKKELDRRDSYEKYIQTIKKVYAEAAHVELGKLERDIKYLENQVAKYHISDYWKRRLSQYLKKRGQFVAERDKFLTHIPEHPEQFIKANSAQLGIKIEIQDITNKKLKSVILSLGRMWGWSRQKTELFIGLILTITIELCIWVLSYIASTLGPKPVKITQAKASFADSLCARFDDRTIRMFLQKSKEHFQKTGKFPPLRHLSKKFRPVRKYLEAASFSDLEDLFKQ